MNDDDQIVYMDYLWVECVDDAVVVGVNEEGLEGFDLIETVSLPTENTDVTEDEVCGELETDQGPFNLYSPIDGTIIEINEAVVQNPNLIFDDPTGDGWLYKIEPNDLDIIEDLAEKLKGREEDNE